MTESSQLSHASPLVEVRYFTALRDTWELLLLRARQLGVRTVVARVPWAWHAPTRSSFDFDGTTDQQRDLVGFVRLCSRFSLHVLLHPGPLHGDLLGGGVPAWLLQQHPAACALGPDGTPWHDAGGLPHPSALHPVFLEAAREWIAAFSAATRAFQAPAGPISALHTSAPDRLDYNQAVAEHPNAPERLPEIFSTFSAWYSNTVASTTGAWLRAEGWTVALRHGQPWEADRRANAQLLELPDPSHPLLDAAPTPIDGLLRSDGSPRLNFWRTKIGGLLIAAAGEDAANASAPADLALANSQLPRESTPARDASLALAQRLRHASVAFDMIDFEAATPQQLARYALVIIPGAQALSPATQQKLAQSANIMLLDGRADSAASNVNDDDDLAHAPRLPSDISADQLAELIEQRGGIARYAWADGTHIELAVRYGATHTYLAINNRRPTSYNGILAYRGRDSAVLHLHAGIGTGCTGMVLLTDDEVYGAAIDGDGAEGGWLARGLRSSAMFNTGAGALVRCGTGLLLTAAQSGRFQARRAEGWVDLRAHRLLLSGALLPAQMQLNAAHVAIGYVADDARGQTDMYIIMPADELPSLVRSYLATLLTARAAMLRRAALLSGVGEQQHDLLDAIAQTVQPFNIAADQLELAAEQLATLDEYSAAWADADDLCRPALTILTQALTRAHGALLAEQLAPAAHEAIQQQIARIVKMATQLGMAAQIDSE